MFGEPARQLGRPARPFTSFPATRRLNKGERRLGNVFVVSSPGRRGKWVQAGSGTKAKHFTFLRGQPNGHWKGWKTNFDFSLDFNACTKSPWGCFARYLLHQELPLCDPVLGPQWHSAVPCVSTEAQDAVHSRASSEHGCVAAG